MATDLSDANGVIYEATKRREKWLRRGLMHALRSSSEYGNWHRVYENAFVGKFLLMFTKNDSSSTYTFKRSCETY